MRSLVSCSILLVSLLAVPFEAWAEARIEMRFKLAPVGAFTASSSRIKGYAFIEEGQLKSPGIFLDISSLKTGLGLRDRHLWHELRYEQFPVASFSNISVHAKLGPGQGIGKGTLQVRGKNKRIFFKYKFVSPKQIMASFTLNIDEFGDFNLDFQGVRVHKEVEVKIMIPTRHFYKR